MTINGNILATHIDYVTSAVEAFMPIIAMVSGVFIAFAIINLLRHTIKKMTG